MSVIANPLTNRTVARAIPRVAPARPEERWRTVAVGRRLSGYAVALVVASLAVHAMLLTAALFGARAEPVTPQEIPIEVVREMPTPEPPPAVAESIAKPPAPTPEAPKPPPLEAAAPSATKPPAPVAAAKPAPPSPPEPPPAETQKAELEQQLAELEAERQALAKEDTDLGPLRDSIHAIALPGVGDGADGELVGYQSLVFSQLAKAKDGAREAAKPATVGVRFSLGDDGGLVDLAVAVSSGVPSLDAESLAIVRRAAPFPRPPAGADRSFSANFAYAGAAR